MRHVGRITEWNDERGFGFVVPHDGGMRAFVHIKSFQSGSRRPENGDLICYLIAQDAKGRSNASSIRFAGQKVAVSRPASRQMPRRTIAVVFAVILAAGTWSGVIPTVIAIAYAGLSVFSFLSYFFDKSAASRGGQRTSEATLHVVDLLGGWPGALVAQHQFRHKTVKASFQRTFWFTVIVNVGLVGWLLASGKMEALLRTAGLQ